MTHTYAPLIFKTAAGDTVAVGDLRYGSGGGGGGAARNAPGELVLTSDDTTGITDTQAIQYALDRAGEVGGGIVWLDGEYWINQPLRLATGVSLRGTGWHSTVIHLAPASNCSMIVGPEGAYWYEVRDLQLDGHKEDQTAGKAGIELVSNTAPDGEMASCGVPLLERVLVRYTWGDGIYSKAVEARHVNCFVFRAGRYAFHADRTDMWYTDCTAGESVNHGFYFSGNASECRMSGCKAWWPGYGSPRGYFAWKTTPETLLNPEACSYYIDTGADHQQIVNCESQDAAKHGFVVRSARNRIDGEVSRNEGACVYLSGAQQSIIRITAGFHSPVAMGLRASPDALVQYGPGAGQRNDVEITWVDAGDTHAIQAGQIGAAVGDAIHTGNRIIMGSPEAVITRTWAATITPDPIRGGVDVTATGNTTIANPPDDRMGNGMEFSVAILQDGTGGRTVTWGSRFAGVTPADTTPNKRNVWSFKCMHGRWVQTAHAVI